MGYATPLDMFGRWGEEEMLRLAAPGDDVTPERATARLVTAIEDASAVIDSHLRARYRVPLSPVPREVVRACCLLARFDLQLGGPSLPSKEMREERDAVLAWLRDMASSEGKLDAAPAPTASDARVQDRPRLTAGQEEVRNITALGWP